MARGFDHFMVHVRIGRNRKLRRTLTPEERWCYVAGVLAIASDSPIRGRLLIGNDRADEVDIADEAGVRVAAARSMLKKLRDLEILEPDSEFDCERVHDFHEHNPEPKKDGTAAERMRRRRARLRAAGQTAEVPAATRRAVFERDGRRCLACDATDDLTIDHITPVIAGGTHDLDNLGTLCGTCNRMKGVTLLFEPNGHVTATPRHVTVTPTEVEEKRREEKTPLPPVTGGAVELVFSAWVAAAGRDPLRTKLSAGRRGLIKRRLGDYPVDELVDAVRGWRHSPHHRGENDRGTAYNDIELLLRDAQHVEKFRDLERNTTARPQSATGQNVLRIDRRCRRCKVRDVRAGYGAYCEQCSEELAS